MYESNGCGLAAPQVGVRKRIVVIDVDDGNQYVLINPEILETSGSQTGKRSMKIWRNTRSRRTDFLPDAFSMSATTWTENFMWTL